MKVLIGIGIGIVVIALIVVGVLGYFGFIPGVSDLFGTNKPKELGTTFTQQDYNSAIAKSGIQFNNGTDSQYVPKSSKVYGPPKQVSMDLTESEVLALLNDKPMTPNYPMSDFEFRINDDNTVEASAMVDIEKLSNTRLASNETVKEVLDNITKAGLTEVPVYMKGDVSVVNGQLNLNAQDVKVGNLGVSAEQINENEGQISSAFVSIQSNIPGLSINNASIVNGKLHFDGTLPGSVSKR